MARGFRVIVALSMAGVFYVVWGAGSILECSGAGSCLDTSEGSNLIQKAKVATHQFTDDNDDSDDGDDSVDDNNDSDDVDDEVNTHSNTKRRPRRKRSSRRARRKPSPKRSSRKRKAKAPAEDVTWIVVKASDDPKGASTCEAACHDVGKICNVASYRDEEVNELVVGDWNANWDEVVKILKPIAQAAGMAVDDRGNSETACSIQVPQWHSPHVAPVHTLFTSSHYTLNHCFDGYRGKRGPPTCDTTMKSYYCAGFSPPTTCEEGETLDDESGGINTEMFCPCK